MVVYRFGPSFLFSFFFFPTVLSFFDFSIFLILCSFLHFFDFSCFSFSFFHFFEEKTVFFSFFLCFFLICFIAGISIRVKLFPPQSVLHGDVVSWRHGAGQLGLGWAACMGGEHDFNSPEWGGGSSPEKSEPPQIVPMLLLLNDYIILKELNNYCLRSWPERIVFVDFRL